jgi:hypothetical protein
MLDAIITCTACHVSKPIEYFDVKDGEPTKPCQSCRFIGAWLAQLAVAGCKPPSLETFMMCLIRPEPLYLGKWNSNND